MLLPFPNPTFNTPTISTKNLFLYFSQFCSPYIFLFCSQNHRCTPNYHSLLLFHNSSHLPAFYIQPSPISTPKIFSLPQAFIQFRLSQRTRDLGSIMRTDTFLISSFFVKVWKMIAGFTIVDSLSFRLRKLVYCK